MHPWVLKFYPVLGVGSGEMLLWHFQTQVLYWIDFALRLNQDFVGMCVRACQWVVSPVKLSWVTKTPSPTSVTLLSQRTKVQGTIQKKAWPAASTSPPYKPRLRHGRPFIGVSGPSGPKIAKKCLEKSLFSGVCKKVSENARKNQKLPKIGLLGF